MSTQVKTNFGNGRFRAVLGVAICAVVSAVAGFGLWATRDRNWEQEWKDRIRVETPRGAEKAFVLSWIDLKCDCIPHVDAICEDTLQGIPIAQIAGVQASDVTSYSRMTVSRKDLIAGERDQMRIYHFFGADDRIVGTFSLPFHELARFEQTRRLLASR